MLVGLGFNMRLKQIIKQNKGMSLVELLVAMAIFVAAIIPMMYAFVYSTGYNFKAQRTMQSTGIAQAIIEKCKGQGVDAGDIISGLTSGELLNSDPAFTVGSVSPSMGTYWLKDVRATNVASDTGAGGVDAGNASRRYYDVKVEFQQCNDDYTSPSQLMGSGVTDSSSIQSMSAVTANFCDLWTDNLKAEDAVAQATIISIIKNDVIKDANVTGYTPKDGLASSFSESNILINRIAVDRYIYVTATNSGVNVKVEYYLNNGGYDGDSDGTGDSSTFTLSPSSKVISGVSYPLGCSGTLSSDYSKATGNPFYVADFDGTPDNGFDLLGSGAAPVPATAIYFYYYPGYVAVNADHISLNDHFILDNQMSSSAQVNGNFINRLDFYLFKQYDTTLTSAEKNRGEHNYQPEITMINDVDLKFDTYLYHNLLWDVEDGSSLSTYHPDSNIHEGTRCHNMTIKDINNSSYAAGFRDNNGKDNTFGNSDDYQSYVLSDYATLPYRSEPQMGTRAMYQTRFMITVSVYPAGETTNPIEVMSAEILNW